MALGTTTRPTQKRNDIIRKSLRDVKAIKPGEAVDGNLMKEGVVALNDILREEDQDQTGQKRFLHALKTGHLFLDVGRRIYTSAEGLEEDIQEFHSVRYRDNLGGETPIDWLTPVQFERRNKLDTGDPVCVLLQLAQDTADNELLVYPIPRVVGTTSTVLGTDGYDYQCILKHTSAADNRPITGSDWKTYWKGPLTTQVASAWVDATAYTNGALLRYQYKRPLFNFDTLDDDPDVPNGWANYLRWRLSIDIASSFDVKDEDRNWFERRLAQSIAAVFPSNQAKTSDYHHKTLYF